jgi:RHS repeat-associated protein
MGRVTQSTQTTDGQSYSLSYGYNLTGALTSQTYPSGRVVATDYDNAGRISGVKNSATNQYYAGDASTGDNRIQYAAHGAISDLRLGNGLWEHSLYNNRLQPYEIGLGTAKGGIDRLKLAYSYTSGTNTTDNNGNVRSQTITVPTIGTVTGFTATQNYTYDSLNRLQSMSETGGLSQTFDYDRYGNRIITAGFVQNTTQTPNTIQNQTTIADWYDQNTNKLKTASYDPAGNVIKDTAGTNPGNIFDYDSENKQVRYDNGSVSGGADYKYDGDGRRIKKIVGTGQATTIYVYDAMGQMVAEYATTTPTGNGGTSYFTEDHLGTPRIITDASGNVKARHDYLPFGEELAAGVSGRTTAQGYGNFDGNRKRWAQLERDDETGLDYAKARYYSNAQGRFTTVDPLQLSGSIFEPQIWNRYTYCVNNPLKYIDPLGLSHWTDDGHFVGDKNREYNADLDAHLNAKKHRWDFVNQGSPVMVRWSESVAQESMQMLLNQAREIHRYENLSGLMEIWRTRMDEMARSQPWRIISTPIPPERQLDIDQAQDPIGHLLWLNYYLRRHLNVFGSSIGQRPDIIGIQRNVNGGASNFANAADAAENWLGPGYREIAPGVYRSSDGLRQFRMTNSDLTDPRQGPHVHFEAIDPNGFDIIENSHLEILDP